MKKLLKIQQDDTSIFDEIINKVPADIKEDVKYSISITERIRELLRLKFKGKQSLLAQHMGKTEAEISKWLSGTHNFTIRTLAKLEDAFGEKIISVHSNCFLEVSSEMKVSFNELGYMMELSGVNLQIFHPRPGMNPIRNSVNEKFFNCLPLKNEPNVTYQLIKRTFQEANLDRHFNYNPEPSKILA